jgi:hypothetical protein
MKGLKEAIANVVFTDRGAIIDLGRKAYMFGIELRNNPRKTEGERKLWEIGWTQRRDEFTEFQRRTGGKTRERS